MALDNFFLRRWVEAFLFFQIEACEGNVSDSWVPEYWIFWRGSLVDLDWQKQWSSWEKHPTAGPGSTSRKCPWWECFELLQVIFWFLWPSYVPCVWSLTCFFQFSSFCLLLNSLCKLDKSLLSFIIFITLSFFLLLSSQIPTEAVCPHVHGSAILGH